MNRISRSVLSLGCAALACVAVSAQTTTNVISETTFDAAAGIPWSYGYYYNNNGLGTYAVQNSYYFPDDTDMTNAVYQYTFDDTDLAGATGWGTGTGAPLFRADTDPALFVSGDRGDYILTFDAKVAGLADGQTNANGEMQFQFYRKDDNGQDQNFLQVNIPFQPTTNWQTFRFTLDQGGLGAGTLDSDFAAHHAEVSDIRFNVNFDQPFNAFGNDGDNEFDLDNVKLEVVSRPTSTNQLPTFTKAIVDWNMDDKAPFYHYEYDWSANDNHAAFSGDNTAGSNTDGVDSSTAWEVLFDNSSFVDNTPSYAGIGSGGGGPVDFTAFDTADLSAYRVTFDARVAGLPDGTANTAAVLQLFLDAPDDAVAVDDDTNNDSIGRFDFQIGRLTTDWQTYTFTLNHAGTDTPAAKSNFTNLFNKIVDLRTQWQIENAASATDWGYDADNALYIDNIKIERVYQGIGALAYTTSGSDLVLNWTPPGDGTTTLQSASKVDGPYTDVTLDPGATTYTASATEPQKYFRLSWTPPVAP